MQSSFFVSVLLFAFASCDNESDDVIRGKISDVLLTVNDTDYDFYENVSFVDENGRRMEFTCNDSVVEFGKAGKYTLIYQVGVMQYERLVYIYGAPTISVSNAAVEYQDAIVKDFSAYVKATDTFGKEVPVSLNGDLQYDSNGAVVTGKKQIFANRARWCVWWCFQQTPQENVCLFVVQVLPFEYSRGK